MYRRSITRAWLLCAVGVVALVVLLAGVSTVSAQAPSRTIVLHLNDYMKVPRAELEGAQEEAARIFGAAGISLAWVGPNDVDRGDGRKHVDLVLLNRDMAERLIAARRIGDHALGQALRPAGRAWVFCHRVAGAAGASVQEFQIALGRVIAHEVGHLLLPSHSHSLDGIMRAALNLSNAPQRFSQDQVVAIRAELIASELTSR